MPFHDQPGHAVAAAHRLGEIRRSRIRDRITDILRAHPRGITPQDLHPRLGISLGATRRALNSMTADGLTRREPWDYDPRRHQYSLTAAGRAAEYPADQRPARGPARGSAADMRARTRTAIISTLHMWPVARTARYIADHTGLSASAVRRAIAPLVDNGDILMTPHPFNARLRTYHLPHTGTTR